LSQKRLQHRTSPMLTPLLGDSRRTARTEGTQRHDVSHIDSTPDKVLSDAVEALLLLKNVGAMTRMQRGEVLGLG